MSYPPRHYEPRLPNPQRTMQSGMAIKRRAVGQVLQVCQELAGVKKEYPSLSVKGLGVKRRVGSDLFTLYETSIGETRRRQAHIGHLSALEVCETVLDKVPSLGRPIPVKTSHLEVQTDAGGTYISLIPGVSALLQLARERHRSLNIMEDLAGNQRGLHWGRGYFELLVAFAPAHAADGTVDAAVDFLESRPEPTSFTLLPADF